MISCRSSTVNRTTPFAVVLLYCLLTTLGTAGAFPQEDGRLVDLDEFRIKRTDLGGCAAIACYMVLQTKRPSTPVALDTVLAGLPATHDCSVAEIVSFLKGYKLSASPVRVSPLDLIPPKGEWNIILDESRKRPHWFGIYCKADGSVALYGSRGPSDLLIIPKENATSKLKEVEEKLRAITGEQDPKIVTLLVREMPGHSMASYQIAGLVLVTVGLVGLGCRKFHMARRVKLARTLSGTLVIIVAPVFLLSEAHAVPKLEIENKVTDLGVLVLDPYKQKHVQEVSYRLENKGSSLLEVQDIKFSCSCTSYKIDQKQIPPGDHANLVLSVDIKQGTANTASALIKTNEPENSYHKLSVSYRAEMLWKVEPKNLGWFINLERPEGKPKRISVTMVRPAEGMIALSRVDYDHKLFAVKEDQAPPQSSLNGAIDTKSNALKYDTHMFTVEPVHLQNLTNADSTNLNFEFASGTTISVPMSIAVGRPVEVSPGRLAFSKGRDKLRLFVRVRESALDPTSELDVAELTSELFDLGYRVEDKNKTSLAIIVSNQGGKSQAVSTLELKFKGVIDPYRSMSVPIRYIDLDSDDEISSNP